MGGKPRFGSFLVIEPTSMIVFQIYIRGIPSVHPNVIRQFPLTLTA